MISTKASISAKSLQGIKKQKNRKRQKTCTKVIYIHIFYCTGNTPLHNFVSCFNIEENNITDAYTVLELFKNENADLDSRNSHGETPLHLACLHGRERQAKWLIREGVDINTINK